VKTLYIDTSSFMRAFLEGSTGHYEAKGLLSKVAISWVSSTLLRLEARRTSIMYVNENRYPASLLNETDEYITNQISLFRITDHILFDAFCIRDTIKSADAIHLATAKQIETMIDGVVTSDKSMYRVGNELGLNMLTIAEALELFG